MTERPILFSGPMVRAILEGRKTQTRRVIKPQPRLNFSNPHLAYALQRMPRCPYGQPGDRLWVRETWRIGAWNRNSGEICVDYKADGYPRKEWLKIPDDHTGGKFDDYWRQCITDCARAGVERETNGQYKWNPGESPCRWRPSIHMPRWASRISLEITNVREGERVQDISEADAIAEGIYPRFIKGSPPIHTLIKYVAPGLVMTNAHGDRDDEAPAFNSARAAFERLWDSINANRGFGWEANPMCWVVDFEPVEVR